MKVDLHVHSKFSTRPSMWWLQKLDCPESFTEPLTIYDTARKKGMSLVTISDHNTINGALEIAHLPGAFISEEVTTYFPDNRCKLHVLVHNISEKQHDEIQKIRENVIDLVRYCTDEKLTPILAHPLFSINDRLRMEHIEQMMLLFQFFELNGARNERENNALREITGSLNPELMDELSNKYNLSPFDKEPWKKILVGGSDDHSGLNIARTFTSAVEASDLEGFLTAMQTGRVRVISDSSTPQTLAHNLYGIAYQFYKNKLNLEQYNGKDMLLDFLDRNLLPEHEPVNAFLAKIYLFLNKRRRAKSMKKMPDNMMAILRHETEKLIQSEPSLQGITSAIQTDSRVPEEQWFDFVNKSSNQVMMHSANYLLSHLPRANFFNIFHTIGSFGGFYTILAPYFISYSLFTKDRQFSTRVRNHFSSQIKHQVPPSTGAVKVAHFTDTFYDVNGVARTMQQQIKIAMKNKKQLTVITCDSGNATSMEGVRIFQPVGSYELPDYEQQKLLFPPFLEMLDFCYRNNFTHIHSATPGPIGLAALAIARILKVPLIGTYHTAFPQFARFITGDTTIEELTWRYTLWYYDQMDYIYVPSMATGKELTDKGVRQEKIRLYPRGINTELYHPSKKSSILRDRYGINGKITLLYVGRVSKEKNLPLLCEVFAELEQTKNVQLVVVGEGPYLAEMKERMCGQSVTFTGYLQGEELASVYASADIFVFPSTTDTFGNVVLESQASGTPVIVTDQGGPQENMISGETGIVARAEKEELIMAINRMLDHPDCCRQMGHNGRQYMENRSFENAFLKTWKMFAEMTTQKSSFNIAA